MVPSAPAAVPATVGKAAIPFSMTAKRAPGRRGARRHRYSLHSRTSRAARRAAQRTRAPGLGPRRGRRRARRPAHAGPLAPSAGPPTADRRHRGRRTGRCRYGYGRWSVGGPPARVPPRLAHQARQRRSRALRASTRCQPSRVGLRVSNRTRSTSLARLDGLRSSITVLMPPTRGGRGPAISTRGLRAWSRPLAAAPITCLGRCGFCGRGWQGAGCLRIGRGF